MKQIKHTFEEKKKMGGKASMWNLWHGCHKWSEGCRHCYVYRTDGKYGKDSSVVTDIIRKAGFNQVSFKRLTLGICTLYLATK